MTKTTPKPKKEQAPPQPIAFRPIVSNGTYSVGLYVQGELDEIVFTLDSHEPRDVTVQRLAQAFAIVFNVAAELGTKNEQARQYMASPEAQPTTAEMEADAQADQA